MGELLDNARKRQLRRDSWNRREEAIKTKSLYLRLFTAKFVAALRASVELS